jgi:O-antigen/teichoic acid export membrane protein
MKTSHWSSNLTHPSRHRHSLISGHWDISRSYHPSVVMTASNSETDGRRQIAGGVVVSWVAQIIQIAAGFIIPRWIDHGLGRETLGIWDLAWSLVSYLTLLEAGIGSSVNRHVALYRVQADVSSVNRVVSSVAVVQRAVAVLVLGLTVVIALGLSHYLHHQPLAMVNDAKWLVLILGSSVAFSLSGAIYTGVVTGCHRWAAHHTVYAFTNVFSAVGMCCVLKAGFGIIALGIVHLTSEILGRVIRAVIAYRVCPGLSIKFRNVSRATMRQMIGFGGRMFMGQMSGVLMVQTINVLIAAHLGPAVLALFSRPRSLIRQAAVFPQKYAFMLAPAAAALSGRADRGELQRFVKESARYGICLSLPVMVLLAIDGGPLLQIWMGKAYANSSLMVILTFGFAAEIFYQPLNTLLLGLNLHGRPGFFSLIAAGCAIMLSWLALRWGAGITAIALAIALPWSMLYGIYLPFYACRRVHISIKSFLKDVWIGPISSVIPFSLCLLFAKWSFSQTPVLALLVGAMSGGLVLLVCYWFLIFPEEWKNKVRIRLGSNPTEVADAPHPDAELQPDFVRK